MCGFTDEEIDRLENYCLALDIKGYKKGQQAWDDNCLQFIKKHEIVSTQLE